jgi:hypothetical protein
MTRIAGWNLQLDRCALFDQGADPFFSFNIVTPYCHEAGVHVTMSTKEALAAYPQFLYPHLWSAASYRLYWNNGAGSGVPVDSAPLTLHPDWDIAAPAASAAADAVQQAVLARCREAQDTFSASDEAFGIDAGTTSLAHALTHLTHWPSGLSDKVMARCGHLQLSAADAAHIPAGAEVAVFPTFVFNDGGGAAVTFTPAAFTEQTNPPRWTCQSGDYQLTCPQQAFQPPLAAAQQPEPPTALALTQSRMSTLDLRGLVASHFHPLLLLSRSLAPLLTALSRSDLAQIRAAIGKHTGGKQLDANDWICLRSAFDLSLTAADLDPLAEWAGRTGLLGTVANASGLAATLQAALVQLSGCGWDRPYVGPRATTMLPHLYQILPDWKALQQAAGNLALPDNIRLDDHTTGNGVVSTATAQLLLGASFDSTKPTVDDFKLLFSTAPEVPGVAAAWLRLAAKAAEGSSGQEFNLRWLQQVDNYFFAAPDDKKKWQAIHERIVQHIASGASALVWYERNAQGALDHLGRRALSDRMQFWTQLLALASEAAKAEAHDPLVLASAQQLVADELLARIDTELGITPPAVFIRRQVQNFVDDIMQRSSLRTALQAEPGLSILFDAGGGADDSAIRGYAIALQAGVPGAPAGPVWHAEGSRWITDTAFNLKPDTKALLELNDSNAAWLPETIGSTLSNGQRVVAAEYLGYPLNSVPYRQSKEPLKIEPAVAKDRDFDGFDQVEFLWPQWLPATQLRPLPLLGYGLCYRALAAPIGNAGGVLADCRVAGTRTLLQDANAVFAGSAPVIYFRSRHKVNAPDVRLLNATRLAGGAATPRSIVAEQADAYALSDQTRAYARLVASVGSGVTQQAPEIALLTDDSQVWDTPYRSRSYQLIIRPPRADVTFVERWLNADVQIAELPAGTVPAPNFPGGTAQKIAAFRDLVLARLRATEQPPDKLPNPEYHPAVAAIGVTIRFGAAGTPQRYAHPLQPVRDDGAAYAIDHVHSTLTLTVRGARAAETSHYDPATSALVLAHGEFARVTLQSLVDSRWVSDAAGTPVQARFHDLAAFSEFIPDAAGAQHYRTCEGSDYLFEMAPAAAGTLPLADNLLAMQGPTPTRPLHLGLALHSTAGLPADWLHGAHYLPYDFHWTGYPLDFPAADTDAPANWLTAHAKASTERPELENAIVLGTAFDAQRWVVGQRDGATGPWIAGITERNLADGPRPATQSIYTVGFKTRFRAWLQPLARFTSSADYDKSPLHLESVRLAAASFVAGVAPDLLAQRLPVPSLRTAVPLTATYWSGATLASDALPQRQLNGNMLIFDEAIRRTDAMATVGGIGDIMEIDLQRSRSFDGAALDNIGPNPIFHGRPDAAALARKLQLTSHAPFGLTYDQSDNGLVVQTGLIVVPRNGGGEWLLGQARARRVILPEVLMGTELNAIATDAAAKTSTFRLPLRQEGDDYVPLDFCIDIKAGDQLAALHLQRPAEVAAPMPLPAGPASGYRLLVSWHKARYHGADRPGWRVQILLQQRLTGQLDWQRIGKLGCDETGFDWLQTSPNGELLLSVGNSSRVHIVPMSDYSPGIWLSFIGNFAATAVEPDDFVLSRSAQNHLTFNARPGRTPTPPECIALAAADSDTTVEFHWLLVYRPLRDVTRSDIDNDAGLLLGAWRYTAGHFEPLDLANQGVDLSGCYGYLCTFQRTTALSDAERGRLTALDTPAPNGTQALIERLFENQSAAVAESTLRMVPKVLGQIAIT